MRQLRQFGLDRPKVWDAIARVPPIFASFSVFGGSPLFYPRYPRFNQLAKEAFGAFEEALVQRGIFLADERGKFLKLPPLFRIQACRHLHHHARE